MSKPRHILLAMAFLLGLGGCEIAQTADEPNRPHATTEPAMEISMIDAVYLETAPSIDDPVWGDVSVRWLSLDLGRTGQGETVCEPGSIQLAYTDQAVYLRVHMEDRDLVTLAERDNDELYKLGDVVEWFIGFPPTVGLEKEVAADRSASLLYPSVYVELHAAPNGLRTAYRWVRPGLIEKMKDIPFTFEYKLDGSLNRHEDADVGWTVLFELPWSSLAASLGAASQAELIDRSLTMMVGRYNYGHYLPYPEDGNGQPELTMWPAQPWTRFHLREYHSPIDFRVRPLGSDR